MQSWLTQRAGHQAIHGTFVLHGWAMASYAPACVFVLPVTVVRRVKFPACRVAVDTGMLRHRTSLPATGPAASLIHLTRRTRPTRATSSHPCQRCSKPSALRVCFVAGAQHPPLHEGTLQSRGPVASRLAAVRGASPCGQQTDLLLVTAPCRAARGHQAADTAASGTNRLTHNGHGYSSSRSRCV